MGVGSQQRVSARDEQMHPLEDAKNFNESMYFNLFDPDQRIGGFFRIGNRPNEGHAEMTVAIYLDDGSVAFMYQRVPIEDNQGFDAGGLKIEVAKPFEDLVVSYRGEVLTLADPLALANPKAAFNESPRAECALSIRFADVAPAWGGELTARDDSDTVLADFWRGHYEGHTSGSGTLSIDGRSWDLRGFGLRDHSWGPRTWQSLSWYRWLTANFDRDGFVLSLIGEPSGAIRVGGALLIDGEYQPVRELELESKWDEHDLPGAMRLRVGTDAGSHSITGTVSSTIPLRHRRRGENGIEQSRIGEGLTTWSWDGRSGHGWSEYLDLLVDGRPSGVLDGV
jgi:hypothetical protein